MEEPTEGRRALARTESASSDDDDDDDDGGAAECESLDRRWSERHFASEWEEIPSLRWLTPSFRSNHPPPPPARSDEKASSSRPVVADAWGRWVSAIARGLRRGQRRRKEVNLFDVDKDGLLLQKYISTQKGEDGRTGICRLFTIRELKEATESFSDSRVVGRGSHGAVYMGILRNQERVAIKKSMTTRAWRIKDFINEVNILSQVIHRNVVRLLGCCLETKIPLLVYEFVPNGRLFDHIHGVGVGSKLSWDTCLRIATETATALAHLHSATYTQIIHRDVKSINILLDENYRAKLSGFGISRPMPHEWSHLTTAVAGTLGYVAPEYFTSGHLTEKSDVYSFGVVLAELLLSERPISFDRTREVRYIAPYLVSSLESQCLEQVLDAQILEEAGIEHLYQVAELARRCLSDTAIGRPTMKEVAKELEELRKPQNQGQVEHSYADDASGSDHPFVAECEEIPSFRQLSPSFWSSPPQRRSDENARQVVLNTWGEQLSATMCKWSWKEEHIFGQTGDDVRPKLFTFGELKKATNNFSESRIIGRGRHSAVYMGMLQNGKTVAVKKLMITNESQIEKFVNEVLILSQVAHRNVIKIFGCCVETEVPLLVCEFVPNGALFDHIHGIWGASKISWETRLRIATETAAALAYLHSATFTRIIHGDVKSTNILLDDNYTAKVSDFGASWSIPFERTHIEAPLIEGTLGYVDPQYLITCELTEKSDVYSFGVVLAELLLSEKPISLDRLEEERTLALHFIYSLESKRLEQVLDAQILEEAGIEHLYRVAELARRCLFVKGEDRPTMREVAMELEELRAQNQLHVYENPMEVVLSPIELGHSDADDASCSSENST